MIEAIKDRINILKANTINSYRIQTAYFFENWTNVASTVFYVLTLLLFIEVIYANVNTFAGYSKNEMRFLLLIGQLNFYLEWMWSTNNLLGLIDSVRTGALDTILSKPIPALFYVTFRDISLVNRIKDGLPNLVLIAFMINWEQIPFNLTNVIAGLAIFVFGQIAWHGFRFLFALPVFFTGQSSQIFNLAGTLGGVQDIPYEGFKGAMKITFTSIIPALITAQMATSVILGKANALSSVLLALFVALLFLMLKHLGWIIALRNYSSASS